MAYLLSGTSCLTPSEFDLKNWLAWINVDSDLDPYLDWADSPFPESSTLSRESPFPALSIIQKQSENIPVTSQVLNCSLKWKLFCQRISILDSVHFISLVILYVMDPGRPRTSRARLRRREKSRQSWFVQSVSILHDTWVKNKFEIFKGITKSELAAGRAELSNQKQGIGF